MAKLLCFATEHQGGTWHPKELDERDVICDVCSETGSIVFPDGRLWDNTSKDYRPAPETGNYIYVYNQLLEEYYKAVGMHESKTAYEVLRKGSNYQLPIWEITSNGIEKTEYLDEIYFVKGTPSQEFRQNGIVTEGLMAMLVAHWGFLNEEVPCEETAKCIELGKQISSPLPPPPKTSVPKS
jgi:hypothetical protein